MSGGIDSTVAALLLKREGYEVFGLHMLVPRKEPDEREHLQRIAHILGIEFHVVDLRGEFEGLISRFCADYMRGRTPNPCIVCNRDIKFGTLMKKALEMGADIFATGHYARLDKSEHRVKLLRGADRGKEQSYFLFALKQEQLLRALFPNGNMSKDEVRKIAADAGLPVLDRGESQEICFLDGRDYRDLLRERIPESAVPGEIIDTAGRVIGKHEGIQFYTIGQRRGLGIALGKPIYVVKIDAKANRVVVGEKRDLLRKEFTVEDVNWVSIEEPREALTADAQIRYTHQPSRASIVPIGNGAVRVEFEQPQPAITPGQAAVFYDGDVLLGGGWISEVL